MTERFAKGQGLNNSSPIKQRPSGQVTIVRGQGVREALTNGDVLLVTETRDLVRAVFCCFITLQIS